jgi:hypothetical protein
VLVVIEENRKKLKIADFGMTRRTEEDYYRISEVSFSACCSSWSKLCIRTAGGAIHMQGFQIVFE